MTRTRATLQEIPNGWQGTRATLRIMSRMVRHFKKDIQIRSLAQNIVSDVPGHKNWTAQIKSLHAYVRDNVQYVRDVRGIETLATPIKTLETMQGDCDDQAVLLASLLESIGHPTRFVAMKHSTFGPYVHVYTETKIGANWYPLETTEKFAAGKPMRNAGVMVEHN
jgi:transglutaminase-like putative cysteine protease